MQSFQDPNELKEWLIAKGIDVSGWGAGEAKTVADLWEEIECGEAVLQDDPPLRIVLGIANVIIRRGDRILIEEFQEFSDGRLRPRFLPPAEKIQPGESYTETVLRCLQEELTIPASQVEILESTYQQSQESRKSPSYPGLDSVYTFHTVEAKVEGLPNGEFKTDEPDSNSKDPIKRHYWAWQTQSDVKANEVKLASSV